MISNFCWLIAGVHGGVVFWVKNIYKKACP